MINKDAPPLLNHVSIALPRSGLVQQLLNGGSRIILRPSPYIISLKIPHNPLNIILSRPVIGFEPRVIRLAPSNIQTKIVM